MPLRLDLESETLIGIPAGSRHNQYSLAQLGAVAKSDGWILSAFDTNNPPTIQVWRFSGYRHHQGQVYVVGPWVQGVNLDEALSSPPSPTRGLQLYRLATALEALAKRVNFNGPIQGDSVVFTEDDRLLFLPPAVMKRLNSVKSPADRLASVERYRHPHRDGPDQLVFSLGVSVYRVLCGRYPFDGKSEEDIHDRVRSLQVVSPLTFQPSAPKKLCDTILASLVQDSNPEPTLSAWNDLLGDHDVSDALTNLGDPRSDALHAADEEGGQAERRFARSQFFNRNWRHLLSWGAGAAIAMAILVPIIGRALAPPVTRGLAPEEVVELFYDSINVMDTESMEDAVTGEAGRALINETLHMFLESRMAMANQGGSAVMTASEWDELGRPKVQSFRVYGITELEIQPEQREPSPVFIARYHFWTPNLVDSFNKTSPPGALITERLWLRWDGKDWEIEQLKSFEYEPIPDSVLEVHQSSLTNPPRGVSN